MTFLEKIYTYLTRKPSQDFVESNIIFIKSEPEVRILNQFQVHLEGHMIQAQRKSSLILGH